MSLVSNVGYTNNSDASYTITPKEIDFDNDYSITSETATKVVAKNVTSPADQREVFVFMTQDVDKISQTMGNINPPSKIFGKQFTVKLEEKIRVTSTTDDTFRNDLPVNMQFQIYWPDSQYVTKEIIQEFCNRLVGSLGTSAVWDRIDEILAQNLNPRR